jgi:hypothetical protein
MQCWMCGAPAEGVCRFCGRAICKTHARKRPFLLQVWENNGRLMGLAVEDALHCGVCSVQPQPVDVEFLRPREGGDHKH